MKLTKQMAVFLEGKFDSVLAHLVDAETIYNWIREFHGLSEDDRTALPEEYGDLEKTTRMIAWIDDDSS